MRSEQEREKHKNDIKTKEGGGEMEVGDPNDEQVVSPLDVSVCIGCKITFT